MRRRVAFVFSLFFLSASIAASSGRQLPAADGRFVRIVPAEFMMGCSPGDTECAKDEEPVHRVAITKAFEIAKYEVTQAEWITVMGMNYSEFKGPDHPVENVSWLDAQEFLRRLTARNDGYRYRLPTEAEWEYAARAGTTDPYAGPADEMGWYFENSAAATHPVGQKRPNAWGLYDMSGNVWEWTADWYDEAYYGSSPEDNPAGAAKGRFHTMRGGSWVDGAANARVSNRDWFEDAADFHIGFRYVRKSTCVSV